MSAIVIHASTSKENAAQMIGTGWHAVARPDGLIITWMDDESDEGLEGVARLRAAVKLGVTVAKLVTVTIRCTDGTVKGKAWVPA